MILFTRTVCPACDTLKRMIMADTRLPRPPEVNLDRDPAGLRHAQRLGLRGVPALEMNGRVYVDATQILAALRGG